MLDYHALKVADAALSPPIPDPSAAAAALNAQTTTLPPQDFPALSALNILLTNGDWPKIIARSETRPIDSAGPISAALSAIALLESRSTIQASSATVWAAFAASMGALVTAGDISSASQAAIAALRTPTVPAWPVVLTGNDVTAARSLP